MSEFGGERYRSVPLRFLEICKMRGAAFLILLALASQPAPPQDDVCQELAEIGPPPRGWQENLEKDLADLGGDPPAGWQEDLLRDLAGLPPSSKSMDKLLSDLQALGAEIKVAQ